MLEYVYDNGRKFIFSYTQLKDEVDIVLEMTDEEFLNDIPKILHLACYVCFIKEVPSYVCLSDLGIIHQLIHLLHLGQNILNEGLEDITEIRNNFKIWCTLS